jgi:hypothetical protein
LRVAELVDGPIEVGPMAADFDIGLVDAPARRFRLMPLPAEASVDLRRILLIPPIDRTVADRDAALTHHGLEVPEVHAVVAIPPD